MDEILRCNHSNESYSLVHLLPWSSVCFLIFGKKCYFLLLFIVSFHCWHFWVINYGWLYVNISKLIYFATQLRADISVDSKQSHMTGVHFPLNDEALAKLAELKEKKLSLVQLVSETVLCSCEVNKIPYFLD